ncbi:hypothetical protein BKI52_33160 [marine bacterium AO1-C]|nr:hypothetical protein BKI52_33160 [marine bacterium AO1-C]
MKLIHPLKNKGVVTSTYKQRGNHFHTGIDLAAGVGAKIVAAASGIVVQSTSGCTAGYQRCNKGLGNYCVIDHQNGYYTAYFHFTNLYVKVGQKIQAGEQLGTEGNTGYSFGSHLHFELRIDLNLVQKEGSIDPYPYLFDGKELPDTQNNFLLEIVAVILVVGLLYVGYKRGYFSKVSGYLKKGS